MAKLIKYILDAPPHLYDRICPSVGLSVTISESCVLSISPKLPKDALFGLWASIFLLFAISFEKLHPTKKK